MKHRIVAAIVLTFMCLTTIGCSEPNRQVRVLRIGGIQQYHEGLQTNF